MKEVVAVNVGNTPFMQSYENPIFLLAKKQEIREEILKRIKVANFNRLYPILSNITLSESELEDIFVNWYLNGFDFLIESYGEALRNNDMNMIKLIDEELNKEEAFIR